MELIWDDDAWKAGWHSGPALRDSDGELRGFVSSYGGMWAGYYWAADALKQTEPFENLDEVKAIVAALVRIEG